MYMYSRHILQLLRHLKLLILSPIIHNPIFPQIQVHIQFLLLPLPGITSRMTVNLLISIQYLPQSFLLRHLESIFGIAESVDDADWLGFFCQFANQVLLVFPPWDLHHVLGDVQVQVWAIWAVVLGVALGIYHLPGLFGFVVEPVGDVGACCFDDGLGEFGFDVSLNQLSKIVYIIKEAHPQIIGSAMLSKFAFVIIPSFFVRFRQV